MSVVGWVHAQHAIMFFLCTPIGNLHRPIDIAWSGRAKIDPTFSLGPESHATIAIVWPAMNRGCCACNREQPISYTGNVVSLTGSRCWIFNTKLFCTKSNIYVAIVHSGNCLVRSRKASRHFFKLATFWKNRTLLFILIKPYMSNTHRPISKSTYDLGSIEPHLK